MADISVEFSVVDRFSQAMDRFSDMVEKCANGVEDMSEKANDTNEKIDSISKSSTVASTGFKGFGASMMVLNQALQAFQRIAEPVKQALDDIAVKQRAVIMFGKDAGSAFNVFAQNAAMQLGRVEGEIRKAGMKWQRIGVGGKNIMELTRLADRFANLNPDRSFEDIADTLGEAVKSKDVGGLAELLGGGEGVEKKLRRAGVERKMRSGDVSGALEAFKQVADGFGYTQEKADEMGRTVTQKIQKVVNIIRNSITDMFSDVVKRVEPYIDRILNWIQSDDFQQGLAKAKAFVSNVADAFFRVAEWTLKAARGVYEFIKNNADLFVTIGAVIGVAIAFVKLKAGVLGAISAVKTLIPLMTSPFFIIPAVIIGVGMIFQKVFNAITGESVSFIEALVGIIVGGVVQIGVGVVEAGQRLWNGIVDLFEMGDNFINRTVTDMANWFIDKAEWVRDNFLEIVAEAIQKAVDLISELADSGVGDFLGLKDVADTLQDINNSINNIKSKPMARQKYANYDYSAAKVNVVDSVEISAKAIGFVMDKINGLRDDISNGLFGGADNYLKDIEEQLKELQTMGDDLSKIRGSMTKEQDLRWMKEMAEQRFVNEVNLRQLTPTINLRVQGSGSSPQEYAKALARELQQMADAGTYNAYGNVG